MTEVKIGEVAFHIPGSWAEVPPTLVPHLSPYVGIDNIPNRISMLCLLSGRRKQMAALFLKAARQPMAGWVKPVTEVVDWIWQPRPLSEKLTPIIPGLKWRGENWLLPQDDFADITVEEWAFIEAYLTRKASPNADPRDLLRMVLVIVRPEKARHLQLRADFDGHRRIPFNPELLESQLETYARMPGILILAAEEWAVMAAQWLPKRYSALYSRDAVKLNPFRTTGLMMNIAESGVWGPMDKVKKLLMLDALTWLLKKKMDDDRQKNAK